ncbi:diphthine synthase [Candidatus Woesearchaeota archaeon]|nr:diphthine synthase [Candidatus Woesearchaeota archaeon]
MALHLIGIGLGTEKDITVKGLELVKKADIVYLECYTSLLPCSVDDLEAFYGKQIILVTRDDVEADQNKIIEQAKTKNVALLVIGDALSATTHIDLLLRIQEQQIPFSVVHNVSIMTAVGVVGLQLYKYGKTTSITFPEKNFMPETCYDVVKMNKNIGLHTLLLLDLHPSENKFMTVNQGLQYLLAIEQKRKEDVISEESLVIGCARIGSDNLIKVGTIKELLVFDFDKAPHCIIIPSNLHFMEEEALKKLWRWKG